MNSRLIQFALDSARKDAVKVKEKLIPTPLAAGLHKASLAAAAAAAAKQLQFTKQV